MSGPVGGPRRRGRGPQRRGPAEVAAAEVAAAEVAAAVAELAVAVANLPRLPVLERVGVARALIEDAKRVLSAVANAGVVEARDSGLGYAELAAELGVSMAAVNKAVMEHNRVVSSYLPA